MIPARLRAFCAKPMLVLNFRERPGNMTKRRRTRREAATYLTEQRGFPVTFGALQVAASRGGGPAYQLFRGRALYDEDELDRWAESQLSPPRRSTSEQAA